MIANKPANERRTSDVQCKMAASFSSNVTSFSFKIFRKFGYNKPLCPVLRNSSNLTNADVRKKRNELFNKELERQKGLVTRIEKIEVDYVDPHFGCTMLMNKDISTPSDCAKHINEMLVNRSAIALVNGDIWDMHRSLIQPCKLKFVHFLDNNNAMECNKAFWRSCSFLMGLILERAFKDEYFIELHSWPKPNLFSGSFVYDVNLNMKDWMPKPEELMALTVMFWKLAKQNYKFERLDINVDLALEMFKDNKYKFKQIPEIVESSFYSTDTITTYRVDDHIDISGGPMISRTGLVGNSKICAANPIQIGGEKLVRIQGVAIPSQLRLNPYAFNLLTERAKKLNDTGLAPQNQDIKVAV